MQPTGVRYPNDFNRGFQPTLPRWENFTSNACKLNGFSEAIAQMLEHASIRSRGYSHAILNWRVEITTYAVIGDQHPEETQFFF